MVILFGLNTFAFCQSDSSLDMALEELVGPVKRVELVTTSEGSKNKLNITSAFDRAGNLTYQLDIQYVDGKKYEFEDNITIINSSQRKILTKEIDGTVISKNVEIQKVKAEKFDWALKKTISYTFEGYQDIEEIIYKFDDKKLDLSFVRLKSGEEFQWTTLKMPIANKNGYMHRKRIDKLAGFIHQLEENFKYSDAKFDSYGNWIQRKVVRTSIHNGKKDASSFTQDRAITYY